MIYREEPETFHFLAARDNVPLKSEFKPALKVLSRKPAPMMIEQIDPFTGNKKLKQEDDKNDIEQNDQLTHGQLKLKAQKEREEKQKRYDEARARILGVPSTSSPGENTGHKYLNPDGSKLSQTNRRWGTNVRDIAYDGLRLVDSNQILNARHEYMARKKNTESSQSSLRDDCNISRKPRGPDANGKPGFNFNKKASK